MGEEAKSKIMEMPLQQRLKYGYKKVLDMLLVSGGISIVAVLLVYFGAKANIFGAESGTVATFFLVIGLANVIIVGIVATMIAKKISDQVIDSVLEPLQQIEVVAGELVNGNLHSNLEYHSDDEVGKLAHDLRKSIRTLGTYIDDIDQTMRQFADGNLLKECQRFLHKGNQFFRASKFRHAIFEYRQALRTAEEEKSENKEDERWKGKVWHNIGNCYMYELRFQEAVDCFQTAYILNYDDQTQTALLLAKQALANEELPSIADCVEDDEVDDIEKTVNRLKREVLKGIR